MPKGRARFVRPARSGWGSMHPDGAVREYHNNKRYYKSKSGPSYEYRLESGAAFTISDKNRKSGCAKCGKLCWNGYRQDKGKFLVEKNKNGQYLIHNC
ncbi:MAG: hypothetical protein MUC28_04215 [Planctomycetes bacterium]|jgi:hypothetical protein|nr:hypothetical protein [Planctomycetota bacterium]